MEVPVLVDINSQIISDSKAIHEYLDELYPEPNLTGNDIAQRVETRRLTNWFDDKFAREVSKPFIYEKIFKRYAQDTGSPNSNVIRAAKDQLFLHLDYIGYLFNTRSWLAGDVFSLADITAAAHLSVIDYLGAIDWEYNKDAKHWYMRIKSRPAFRTFLADKVAGLTAAAHYSDLDF